MDKTYSTTEIDIPFRECSYSNLLSLVPGRFDRSNIKNILVSSEVQYYEYDECADSTCVLRVIFDKPVEMISKEYIKQVVKAKSKTELTNICVRLGISIGSFYHIDYLRDIIIEKSIYYSLEEFEAGAGSPAGHSE